MRRKMSGIVAAMLLTTASLAWAADKTYQVTGPIVEITDAKIVVQKGDEKWELARTAATKITGELKVGSKVTIEYTMTAKSIVAKEPPVVQKTETKEKPPKK